MLTLSTGGLLSNLVSQLSQLPKLNKVRKNGRKFRLHQSKTTKKTKNLKNWTYIFHASEISISSKEKEKTGKRK